MITVIYGTLPPGGGRHIGGFTAHVLPTLKLKYRYEMFQYSVFHKCACTLKQNVCVAALSLGI